MSHFVVLYESQRARVSLCGKSAEDKAQFVFTSNYFRSACKFWQCPKHQTMARLAPRSAIFLSNTNQFIAPQDAAGETRKGAGVEFLL
jgi:hypothetical protein